MQHQDDTGARLGMWLFLYTELVLFGGLFLLYAAYRYTHRGAFHQAGAELNLLLGTVNTLILLTSSYTMVLSIHFIKRGKPRTSGVFLVLTILLGVLFLVDKYLEWGAKIHHGIYPDSTLLLQRSSGEILFYGLYYLMTGLHGIHVLAGVILLSVMLVLIVQGKVHPSRTVVLENSGLYWHLVDII